MLLRFGELDLDVIDVLGLTFGDEWVYARHATIEGKEKRQFVAKATRDPKLTVRLHKDINYDPQAMLDYLGQVGDAHEVLPLQTGDGTLIGLYVIEKLTPTWKHVLDDGELVMADVEIQLGEMVEDRQLVPAGGPALAGAGAATTTVAKPELRSGSADDVTTAQIART